MLTPQNRNELHVQGLSLRMQLIFRYQAKSLKMIDAQISLQDRIVLSTPSCREKSRDPHFLMRLP